MAKCPHCKKPLNKRKKASGSRKGSPFEREISKEISFWWSDGERDDLVWRTASSGGRATTRFESQNLMTQYGFGDLCPTHGDIVPLFDLFLFEVKRGYNSKLDLMEEIDLPSNLVKTPQIWEWWTTACRDASRAGRPESMIIGKRDNRLAYCIFSGEIFESVRFFHKNGYRDHYLTICKNEMKLVLTLFTDWFTYMTPRDVKRILTPKQ